MSAQEEAQRRIGAKSRASMVAFAFGRSLLACCPVLLLPLSLFLSYHDSWHSGETTAIYVCWGRRVPINRLSR